MGIQGIVRSTAIQAPLEPQTAPPHLGVRLWGTFFTFPAMLAGLIFAAVYWVCRDRIADPDLWFHLRNAQYVLTNRHFPNFDTYSFTAAGSPWLSFEWLSEIFYYGAFSAWGLQGIFILFTAAMGILLVAVFALCMKEAKDPLAAAIGTIGGALLAMVAFAPRTQTFGWLCFIAIYAILLRFRSSKEGPLWAIPAIFCIWINCHGTWPFGLIVFAIVVGAGLIQRDFGQVAAAPWTKLELKRLLITGLASVAALFVNPFGYRLLMYPVVDMAFRQNLALAYGEEWASVNFHDARGKLVGLILAAIFAMALSSRKRWRIDDALLTLFVLYCGLTHMRFLLLAGIVLPPILAPRLGRLSSYDPRSERRLVNLALLAIVWGGSMLHFPSTTMLDSEISDASPAGAVQFLRTHPQQGHIFNEYGWGGYLEWNLRQVPTFIDTRNDLFEFKGVMKDYIDAIGLNQTEEILDRYQVTYVLYPGNVGLPYLLAKSSRWERIYADEKAVIYRRLPAP